MYFYMKEIYDIVTDWKERHDSYSHAFIPVSISVAVNLQCQESLAAGPSSIGQGQFGDLNNNKFQVVASLGFISLL